MKIKFPQITLLPNTSSLDYRNGKAVFVRKHNIPVNLEAVESETKEVNKSEQQKWLFLVEGHKKYQTVENLFLDSLVEELNITTEDPIINPFTTEIARAISVESTTAALSFLTMDYLDMIADNDIEQLNTRTLEAIYDQSLNIVARAFEISPKQLNNEFSKLKWHNREKLQKQILALAENRKQLINESNLKSKVNLKEILKRNTQPNLFIMSGIEHGTIFTQ